MLICRYCGREIHKSGALIRVLGEALESSNIRASIMPESSEEFPFHDRCFLKWVYMKLKDIPDPKFMIEKERTEEEYYDTFDAEQRIKKFRQESKENDEKYSK